MDVGFLNERASRLIVDQLVKQGVRHFCLSPGSRSTSLALAIAQHPDLEATVHFDERGMAFHALGIAKASKKPVALLVTSGTAVGNLFPAVMEASLAKIPLILLTADRPPELRDNGSNQTLDQVKIFGDFVRWQVDLPCPTTEIQDAYVGSTIAHAVFKSQHNPKGPVHLNCMFREPLLTSSAPPFPQLISTHYESTESVPSRSTLEYWGDALSSCEKGVIIVGNLFAAHTSSSIHELGRHLNWPILADLFSGVRGKDGVLYYDLILKTLKHLKAETVLHFGDRLISKTLQNWLVACKPSSYFLVTNHAERHDPFYQVTHRMECDPFLFCQNLVPFVKKAQNSTWLEEWNKPGAAIQQALPQMISGKTEPGLMYTLASKLPQGWSLFLSNSMPVRDADTYFFRKDADLSCFANRGVSGIDGNLATAIGIAKGSKSPTLAVLGDLAFLHDINSLALLKKCAYPVILLVINNSGGAIFSFLPVAQRKETFEEYFAASHTLTFEKAAELFDIPYLSLEDAQDLDTLWKNPRTCVIEMTTERAENHRIHEEIVQYLCSATLPKVP
jgi:2-succinyl-5-enolpyruvyl-6-hydroxy-3-cyclohexene-1-carboxylate synthase